MTNHKFQFSPSEFMRGKRPEQYSDSYHEDEPRLDKDQLDYRLETLTNRHEEKQFEHLARRLAERLICPNLVPQTGPTGGGDSKVDTETYPVHEEISDLWYEGDRQAGNERWGFAVSAKKQWQGKIRSDMNSIASTGRGYKVAYFISNQFISDKTKSKFQDELTEEHGFEVRILDRTWLLGAILEKGNEDIAAYILNLSSLGETKKLGPNDFSKQEALDRLECEISDVGRYTGVEYQLVEDCITAAIISRELELDRIVTDGRHDRAIRIARKHGTDSQVASALYQKARTAIYWFDDFTVLLEVYDEIEQFALSSQDSYDSEKLETLWITLHAAVGHGVLAIDGTQLSERSETLSQHLNQISQNAERPNNAANAKWLYLSIEILRNASDEDAVSTFLQKFGQLMTSSNHLGAFEFNRAFEFFEVLGEGFGGLEIYDQVFEQILPVLDQRNGETAVGDRLFLRGVDKLQRGQLIGSVDLLGRALPRLMKAEKERRLVRCLAALATAYNAMDLHWAAYANHMSAVSIMLQDFERTREFDPMLHMVLEKMFWGEICTGRVSHALWCFELQMVVSRHQRVDETDEEFKASFQLKDAILSMLFLKANPDQLAEFTGLVDTFDKNGLTSCVLVLLFCFGGPEYLRKFGWFPGSKNDDELWKTMETLWDQPAQNDLPTIIETSCGTSVRLASHLLGVKWEVICHNDSRCIQLGESLIGFLESFLATSLSHDAIGIVESARIAIEFTPDHSVPTEGPGLELKVNEGAGLAKILMWPQHFSIGAETLPDLKNFFVYTLANIMPRVLLASDLEAFYAAIGGVEEGFSRALIVTDVLTSSSNVFAEGKSPSLADWKSDDNQYEIVADPPCNVTLKSMMTAQKKETEATISARTPDDIPKTRKQSYRHKNHQIVSMVDIELWEEAKWNGVAMAYDPYIPGSPPYLGLLFDNKEKAKQIFQNWIDDVGKIDVEEKIRIVLLTGVEQSNKHAYTLGVTSKIDTTQMNKDSRVIVTARTKTMENPDPLNLANFQRIYAITKQYKLVPATLASDGRTPHLHYDLAISKKEISLKEAWTVGLNDPDCVVVPKTIDPIIPMNCKDAPIVGLLETRINQRI